MTITIKDITGLADAAQEFIAQMGDNKIFAFYGSMGADKSISIVPLS